MPIAARLSKKLYDKFGEEVTQEMVDSFDQWDQTYRDDLENAQRAKVRSVRRQA